MASTWSKLKDDLAAQYRNAYVGSDPTRFRATVEKERELVETVLVRAVDQVIILEGAVCETSEFRMDEVFAANLLYGVSVTDGMFCLRTLMPIEGLTGKALINQIEMMADLMTSARTGLFRSKDN